MLFHDSPWRHWLAVPYVSCILNKVSKHWVNCRFKISSPSVIQTFNFLNPVVIYWDMASTTSLAKEVEMIFKSYHSFQCIQFFYSDEFLLCKFMLLLPLLLFMVWIWTYFPLALSFFSCSVHQQSHDQGFGTLGNQFFDMPASRRYEIQIIKRDSDSLFHRSWSHHKLHFS